MQSLFTHVFTHTHVCTRMYDPHSNMDESRIHYAKWRKGGTQAVFWMISFVWRSGKDKTQGWRTDWWFPGILCEASTTPRSLSGAKTESQTHNHLSHPGPQSHFYSKNCDYFRINLVFTFGFHIWFSHIWFSQLKRQLWHYSKGEHIPWAHVIKYRRNFTLISSVFQIMAGQMRSFDGIWFSDRPAQNAARWLPKPDDYTMTLKAEQIMGKLTWHQNRVSAKTERKKKKLGINSFPVFLKTFLISSHSSSGVCSPSCPQFLDSVGVLECDMFVLHPTLPHPWEPLLAGLFINSITSVNAFSPGYINNRIRPEFMQP